MRYFSQKEILIISASIVWVSLFGWFLVFSDKSFGDIAVNLITDILNTAVAHLGILQRYFSSMLGYTAGAPDGFLRDAALNALNRKSQGR
jgi:hypothetical protein